MKNINYSHDPNDNDNDKNTISSLVIARIGGFMELIIIPHDLSHGPILAKRNQKQGRGNGLGHCAEVLPNLSSNIDQIIAIFTSDHHNDLTDLAVHRVNKSDTNQDQGDSDRYGYFVFNFKFEDIRIRGQKPSSYSTS
jgi:hypothetical protein